MSSQVLKTQVVRLLQAEFGADQFDHQNVMISATHTHSGPGGFFQYLLFDITSRGFSNATFEAMTQGIFTVWATYKQHLRLHRASKSHMMP